MPLPKFKLNILLLKGIVQYLIAFIACYKVLIEFYQKIETQAQESWT